MKIVVVSNDLHGLRLVIELTKRGFDEVVLISDDSFVEAPWSISLGLSGGDTKHSAISTRDVLEENPGVKFINDTIMEVDGIKHTLTGKKRKYSYDKVVFSRGLTGTLSILSHSRQLSYAYSGLETAQIASRLLHGLIASDNQKPIKCAIAGDSPVAVEAVCSLMERFTHVARAHAASLSTIEMSIVGVQKRITPKMSNSASRLVTSRLEKQGVKLILNQSLKNDSSRGVVLSGRMATMDLLLKVDDGGLDALFTTHKQIFKISRRGRVSANHYMEAYPDVHVIGASVDIESNQNRYATARHAKFLADHFRRVMMNRHPRPKRYFLKPIRIVSMGGGWAYSEWAGVYAAGASGVAVRKMAELVLLRGIYSRKKAYRIWLNHPRYVDKCALCRKERENI